MPTIIIAAGQKPGGGDGDGGGDTNDVSQDKVPVPLPDGIDLGGFKDGDQVELCGTLRGRTLIAKSLEPGDEAEEADDDEDKEDEPDDQSADDDQPKSFDDLFKSYDKSKQ